LIYIVPERIEVLNFHLSLQNILLW